jgi:beta-N-acetylhexosaminidase
MRLSLLTLILFVAFALETTHAQISLAAKLSYRTPAEARWVDSVYNSMDDTARLGQLFMIRAHSNLGADHIAQVEDLIRRYKVGALCFFQGTPEKQVELTNRYQRITQLPLMVAMDAEWGLNMRLKETAVAYPKQMMLGAIADNSLIYQFGATVARELRRVGVHVNFAPAVDVNNNMRNPVINERSFGEDKFNVAAKGYQYMKGMQDNGVLACAKHFPGHGDTDVDSHYDLPQISHGMARLSTLELMPFRLLAQYGVGSFMVAHLSVPSIDATANLPTSLSKNAVTNLLRREMGYEGVIFTDGLEMKGVTKYFPRGEVSARAIEAGCDMLCLPESTPDAFEAIQSYIRDGRIAKTEIEKSVKRILLSKFRLGLSTPQYVEPYRVRDDINSYEAVTIKRELTKNALTLVRNADKMIPFLSYSPDDMASLAIGYDRWTPFQYQLNQSGIFNQFNVNSSFNAEKYASMLDYFSKKKIVIVALNNMKPKASDGFGLSQSAKDFVNELAMRTKVILVVFGNPYSLQYFDGVSNVIMAYNEDKTTQELTAQAMFGVFDFKGKLPVSASEKSKAGMGFKTMKTNKLEWNLDNPEAAGFNPATLAKIDGIANELIDKGAAPGCQILVAKDGKVVYNKAFGYQTYEKQVPMTTETLFDMASITKCAATTMSLMKLYEEGKIDLNAGFGKYVPILRGSNKENLPLKELLIHQAGLKAWIPFYKETVDANNRPMPQFYASQLSGDFSVEVAKGVFMRKDYVETIKKRIADSELNPKKPYVYSDLGMIMMVDLIKMVTGKTLDVYANEQFFAPLSMSRTLYNPLTKFSDSLIAPTEEDKYFRHQRLQGHVHDMGAAMLGGVSGHAGLFSTCTDLAILMQMMLNGGVYGGKRYLKSETIQLFAQRQGGSTRRGYGWDMKELDAKKTANMSPLASSNTFGHTGFTGNAFYVDPDKKLIYVFLSNRTYPDMNNNKLIDGNFRPRIQTVIYESLLK